MKWKFLPSDISSALQSAFIFSALLTFFVGGISLYAWFHQQSQIRHGINTYLPRIEAAFSIEENLNILLNEYSMFAQSNIPTKQKILRHQLNVRLDQLRASVPHLEEFTQQGILKQIDETEQILINLNQLLTERVLHEEQTRKVSSHLNWLNDSFRNELHRLLQSITKEQSQLLVSLDSEVNSIERTATTQKLLEIQDELRFLYSIATLQMSFANEVFRLLSSENEHERKLHLSSLYDMQNASLESINLLKTKSDTLPLREGFEQLMDFGLDQNTIPSLLDKRKDIIRKNHELLSARDNAMSNLQKLIENQIGGSHQQLSQLNAIIEKSMWANGRLIILAMLFTLVFVFSINFGFIRPRLLLRFKLLNKMVKQLTQNIDSTNLTLEVSGNDELGKIAKLLHLFSKEVQKKTEELELHNKRLFKEVQERRHAEERLKSTQNELIQAAKLAVVGQTLTTLGHEINQPLNALAAYVFSVNRAIERGDSDSAKQSLQKMQALIARSASIIKRLQHFSRRSPENPQLIAVNVRQCIEDAWQLLETVHSPLQARLNLPEPTFYAMADEVLLQQVFVNLFTNALEATPHVVPEIRIHCEQYNKQLLIYVSDNGIGWPLWDTDTLLTPFTSHKSTHLGIGLSIISSIMNKCSGTLYLASTVDKHAMVILQFRDAQDVERESPDSAD